MKTRESQLEYLGSLRDEDIDYSDALAVTDFTNWHPNSFFKHEAKEIDLAIEDIEKGAVEKITLSDFKKQLEDIYSARDTRDLIL